MAIHSNHKGVTSTLHPQHEGALYRYMREALHYSFTFYVNNVFKKLTTNTVAKFTDAQVGNYGVIFKSLSDDAITKLMQRFSRKRAKKVVTDILTKVDKANYRHFAKILPKEFQASLKAEGLTFKNNALFMETQQWVEKNLHDALQSFSHNALRAMAQGKSLQAVVQSAYDAKKTAVNNAKMIARTQITTFNSLNNNLRAQNLGITKGKWLGSDDERERPSHTDRNDKVFDLSKGLYSTIDGKYLHTGIDYNCRCRTKFIIDLD